MFRKLLILLSLAVLPAIASAQDSKENADFKLAFNLYNDGFYDLALEQFRQFVSFYPNTQQGIEARYYLGLSQYALGRYDEARLSFQNFAVSYADHPRAPEAWQKIAESYLAQDRKREAALAYERIHTFHPRSELASPALEKAASLFEELADTSSTIRLLRILTQEYASTGVYGSVLHLAKLYGAKGQYDAAMTEVRKVIEGSQEAVFRAPALYYQATLMIRRGRTADARAILTDIRRNYTGSPAYRDALFSLASLSYASGDITAAITIWKENAADPEATPSLRQRAFFEIGKAEEAIYNTDAAFAAFDSAGVTEGPLSSSAAYRAGRIREREGATAEAARLYLQAAEDTTTSGDRLLRFIGGVRAGQWLQRPGTVSEFAEAVVRIYPDNSAVPRVLVIWGDVALHEQKDPQRAMTLFQQARQHPYGASVEDRALLGIAQSQSMMGFSERSIETYDDLLQRFPASTVRDEAVAERDRIRTYTTKDRDAGTEQLARLLGDVIGKQPSSMLAFRLAEISFLQLRNFELAKDQYRRALDGGLIPENQPIAWFHLGQSLEYLASSQKGAPADPGALREEAREAFESLLRDHPEHPLAQEAFVEVVSLTADDIHDQRGLKDIADRVDSLRLDGRTAARVLMILGKRADELGSRDLALGWYGAAIQSSKSDAEQGELLWRSGNLLARSGRSDTARSLLRQAAYDHGAHPFVAEAGKKLAELEALNGNAGEVRSILDMLSGNYSYAVDPAEAEKDIANAEYISGNFRKALEAYDVFVASIAADPFEPRVPSTETVYRMAVSAKNAGENERALRLFGEVIGRHPAPDMLLDAWYAVAALSEQAGDLSRASFAMEQASQLAEQAGGDATAVSLRSAELLFRNEQYREALASYQKVRSETASDSLKDELEARIIVCYFRLDNLAEADKRATAFVRTHPKAASEAAEFEFERGLHHARQGRVEQARQRFDIVTRRYPNDPHVPQALFWLGRLYEIRQQPDSAAMLYDSLLRRFPDADIAPRVELSLGNVYYVLEQWDNAARYYRRIVDDRSRAPELLQFAMNNLILTYKELTLYDGALQLTREYISLYPDDPEILNKRIDIGVLYQRLGYYDQSVVHLQDLLLTAPSEYEAELRYYIGEAYYNKGEYQQAILEFLKVPYLVVRQGPINWIATSYYMAGQSYEKLSRFDQAIAMYQQIIDRRGIDAQFKTAAQREIDRVNAFVGQKN